MPGSEEFAEVLRLAAVRLGELGYPQTAVALDNVVDVFSEEAKQWESHARLATT